MDKASRGWRCAIGIGGQCVAWVALCDWDWVLCGWRFGRRCAIRIGGEGVAWVALCNWNWRRGRCVGGAVPLGLAGKLLRGQRCAIGIGGEGGARWRCVMGIGAWVLHGWRCAIGVGGEGVAWVALCHWDWRGRRGVGGTVSLGLAEKAWRGCRVGGAVSLGLAEKALRGWLCAIRIGCCMGGGLGGAVPLGLAGKAWRGWRCATEIGGESVRSGA